MLRVGPHPLGHGPRGARASEGRPGKGLCFQIEAHRHFDSAAVGDHGQLAAEALRRRQPAGVDVENDALLADCLDGHLSISFRLVGVRLAADPQPIAAIAHPHAAA